MPSRSCRRLVVLLVCACLGSSLVAAEPENTQVDLVLPAVGPQRVPQNLNVRVRLRAIEPAAATPIRWRYGGEGQGGEVIRGIFPKPGVAAEADESQHALEVGSWSAAVPLASIARQMPPRFFMTVTAGEAGRVDRQTGRRSGHSRNVLFEFQFRQGDRPLKTFVSAAPDGGTTTLVIPAYRWAAGGGSDSPQFLNELTDVLQYARRRAEMLEELLWAGGPLPQKFAVLNNVSGYGSGHGYGIRTTDRQVTLAEMRSLRQLGVNGFRSAPEFLQEMILQGEPGVRPWMRGAIVHVMGFPVPSYRPGRENSEQAGCPFGDGVPAETERLVAESVAEMLRWPVDEVWGLTVDEIGTVIDQSPEKKSHLAKCPSCAAAFQQWLQAKSLTPGDFGCGSWSEVRPIDLADPGLAGAAIDAGRGRLAYYTRDFNNYVTAKLFTPLREACQRENDAKRAALAAGEDSTTAAQPWLYSYALRGNTFLMKGHSLDFFDFYRLADNAIVYETSNRGPQVWSWDSYLCDVQRVVGERMSLARGIYIKPHRGAPLQRMLSAVSRGNTMIYWYTYGPDYHKGDSFSQDPRALRLTSKAAHLLGHAEDALYGARWAQPAEIAVVKPETTQRWMNLRGDPPHLTAAWENAKWIYTALQHAHLPVDPLDEQMLVDEDLTRYKLIYVSGSHLTRAAAAALERYVAGGGTLYTSGGGLARDEADQPLEILAPVLGLDARQEPEMWYEVSLYGATALEPYDDRRRQIAEVPEGARIVGGGDYSEFAPVVGREILQLDEPQRARRTGVVEPDAPRATEVLARFADGRAALTRHAYGRGSAYVAAFFPGLEYSATVRRPDYDLRRDFQPLRRQYIDRPALQRVRPVVEISDPLVEGVLLRSAGESRYAVTLANWAYRGVEDAVSRRASAEHLPVENIQIAVPVQEPLSRVRSCALDRDLEFERTGQRYLITLPQIEEGDVLILDVRASDHNPTQAGSHTGAAIIIPGPGRAWKPLDCLTGG